MKTAIPLQSSINAPRCSALSRAVSSAGLSSGFTETCPLKEALTSIELSDTWSDQTDDLSVQFPGVTHDA